MKHTPGPWTRERDSVLIPAPNGSMYSAYGGSVANARLIAAAPDLLAQAKADDELATFIEATLDGILAPSGQPTISRGFADIRGALAARGATRRAAIAKAEGEK